MLSLTCKAAIKAVIFIGSRFGTAEKAGIKEIAEYIRENEHTLGKLLQKLVKDGIINSAKGPHGGFYISSAQQNQPVIRIVESIDGAEVFDQCGLGFSQCSSAHPCPIHNDFKHVRDSFKKMCEEKRIIDLYEPVKEGLTYLTG